MLNLFYRLYDETSDTYRNVSESDFNANLAKLDVATQGRVMAGATFDHTFHDKRGNLKCTWLYRAPEVK